MIARLFFLMALMLVLPTHSWAANMFEPVAQDESVRILGAMFGQLGIFNGVSDGFIASMAIFNGGVMIVGGVLMIYSLVVGTIGTAHDGEMMGKKYSAVWIPLRTVMATALVLPVINGSYCLMQFIVGWLILQGIGLADAVWIAYMDKESIVNSATMGIADTSYKKAAWDMFASSLCVHGYNKVEANLGQMNSLMPKSNLTVTINATATNTTWNYGTSSSNSDPTMLQINSCGSVSYDKSVAENNAKINAVVNAANHGSAASTSSGNATAINNDGRIELQAKLLAANAAGEGYVRSFVSEVDALGASFANNPSMSPESVETALTNAAANYAKAMKGQAADLLQNAFNFEDLKKNASQEGWILAGAWYMKVVNIMDVANAIVNMGPTTTGTKGLSNGTYSDEFMRLYKPMLDNVQQHSNMVMGIAENTPDKDFKGAGSVMGSGFSAGAGAVKDYFLNKKNPDEVIKTIFKDTFGYFVIQKEDHPMMVMKAMGDYLFKIAGSMVIIFGILYGISEAGYFQGFYEFYKILMMVFLPICIALGFTLNFVMPMMPFMIWLGCVLAWLVLCVEAIVAAPMWAVMHLSMSGDDMVGTGAQGYKLVLSLMLRPVLMIFGFIASLSIVHVVGQFINRVFLNVYLLSQQDFGFITMIFGLLAVPVLYLGTMWVLIIRSMNIVHQIPDQLLQWFGGGGSQLGEAAQSVGGLQSQAFVATAATAGIVKSLPNSMAQFAQQRHHKQQQKSSEMQAEKGEVGQMSSMLEKSAGGGAGELAEKAMSGSESGLSEGSRQIGAGGESGKQQREQKRGIIANKIQSNASGISANPGSSSAVANFNKNVKASLDENPNETFDSAVNKHFPKAFDEENGKGAFELAQKHSGTDNASATESLQNPAFQKSANMLKGLSSSVSQAGGNSGKEMTTAISAVKAASPLSSPPEKMAAVSKIISSHVESGSFNKSEMSPIKDSNK